LEGIGLKRVSLKKPEKKSWNIWWCRFSPYFCTPNRKRGKRRSEKAAEKVL